MTLKKENKKLKKQNRILAEQLAASADHLENAAEDLIAAAGLMEYMSGQIAAYRNCLRLKDD